ncbi:MAG: bifunctional folylpolyglutamate synthase/dihydrofolate synthase, partial [Tepidiformaceae bacterium]
ALFTSPHLHAYTERIAIDGDPISTGEFAMGLEAIRPVVEAERESVHGDVSTFGVLTALFFWLVRAQAKPVRWQVVEVGLGGTFDATNVLTDTDIAVITPISLEHTAILGKTTTAIATDKAGIIKRGCVCVVAPQQDEAVYDVIQRRCGEVGATMVDVRKEYEVVPLDHYIYGQSFQLGGPGSRTRELRTQMLGRHQLDNAATAVAVIDALRKRGHLISDRAIEEGLARTRVHGRMEVMGARPLVIADGAHNGESARALAAGIRDHAEFRRGVSVIGVTSDKDVEGIVEALLPVTGAFIATRFRNTRAMDPSEIVDVVEAQGGEAVAVDRVTDAIDKARERAQEDDLICITGSLYVVAEAREYVLGELVVRG